MSIFFSNTQNLVNNALLFLDRQKLPKTSGNIQIHGIKAPIEIFWDRWGVPHAYAQSTQDILFAKGFVHAQDRLWKMDFTLRLVASRLAEILGKVAIPADRWMHILTIRNIAEKKVDLVPKDISPLITAYCVGVNAFIKQGNLLMEIIILCYIGVMRLKKR